MSEAKNMQPVPLLPEYFETQARLLEKCQITPVNAPSIYSNSVPPVYGNDVPAVATTSNC